MKTQLSIIGLATCSNCIKAHDAVTSFDCQEIDQGRVVHIVISALARSFAIPSICST